MTTIRPPERLGALPRAQTALAVAAHPDEAFSLGAFLAALVDAGATIDALCFTRGEAGSPVRWLRWAHGGCYSERDRGGGKQSW